MTDSNLFFDDSFAVAEQLPRKFTVSFEDMEVAGVKEVRMLLNGALQIGDVIDDNAYGNDYYRYHDIFHYTFATLLGWSPCSRALMKCKRKSNPQTDKVEDGARATITEEAISLMIFNEAKRKSFFNRNRSVSRTTLRLIKEMTEPYEVKVRTENDWKNAISKAYSIFRKLIENEGGIVSFDSVRKEIIYLD